MTAATALWFALSTICDVSGQICFKFGVNQFDGSRLSLPTLLLNRWISVGIAIYTVEIFVWLRVLSEVPLSLAFPLASLNFLGIAFASHVFLKEKIGFVRILGAALVTLGVIVLAASA